MFTMNELLLKAKDLKASDLHITVGVPPTLRVYGDLKPLEGAAKLMPDDTDRLVHEIMIDKQKAHFKEHGDVDFSYAIPQIGRFRVNAFKQRGSAAAAIRVVGSEIPNPKSLGLPDSVIDLYTKKRGLILVTGPTGSGKSTTLASIIAKINKTRQSHIVTLEDPIEYLHRHERSVVNQREVGLDTDSYSSALRSALRQDPDVILVGEMRDLETISIAVTAAETGHLVLSTLHTTGAINTISRVIDVFPPHQQQQIRIQLASVLQSVVSQQLLRTQEGNGRVAAFEVLHMNAAVRSLIREQKTHQILSVMQTNKRVGMQTMEDALLDLLRQGRISREQAINSAVDPVSIQRRLM